MNFQLLSIFCFFFLFLSWTSKKLQKTLGLFPLIALLFGIIWALLFNSPSKSTIQLIARVGLIFFLFVDSSRIHLPKVFHYHNLSTRLFSIGFVLTLGLTTLLGHLLFPLAWKEAFILALPLAAVDMKITAPFSTFPLIPSRVSQTLNIEASVSGLLAIFFLSILLIPHPFHFFIGIFFALILGKGVGFICGRLSLLAIDFGWAKSFFLRGAVFLIPFAVYGLCKMLSTYGLIGVLAAGLAFGHSARRLCDSLFDFSRKEGQLFFYLLLIYFGIFVYSTLSQNLSFPMIGFALMMLFVVRFIAVFFSTLGTGLQWKTRFFFTFFAPKGLISLAVSLFFLESGRLLAHSLVLDLLVTTILLSILLHTLFAYPLAFWYGHSVQKTRGKEEFLPIVSLPIN